ncbi:MAG: primosomal protein N' [Spirochaetia bacterium]|nr:primosomal protein N' [Spirochaetia bacterium]MDY4985653.1 primosomal protein N' [Treponema sp.]
MIYLEIILNLPVNQGFTYSYIPPEKEKDELKPEVGKRAEIMFGNRKTTGFIINISDSIPESCPVDESKIKPVKRIIDKEPLFGKELIEMASWISRYYLCTLGEAIFSMIPSGRRESSAGGFSFEEDKVSKTKNQLSPEQEKAVNDILEISKNPVKPASQFHYVYGPTGTGKTEVFLQLAEKILEQGKGVIYLVPEISLTGQVAQSIFDRFGNTAAILHSGLTASQRLTQWHRIMHKEARVVVGARSAIFAPMPDLGLVIIDEEHDGSYKSGNNPRYHARQVSMHRCARLGIPLVMGSATPSVEAWSGMENGIIYRHTLTKRLAGGTMPHINCINLNNFNNDGCISKPLEDEINNTLKQKKQTILFLNRRGFTHFFRCNSCGYELICKNCSIPLTYHKVENRLRCHYCGWSINPPQSCPECGSLDIGSSGFGTEFIESETKAKFPNARIIRIDTDAITKKEQLLEKLDEFRKGNYDIMLGTQMVAKGLNFPNLQLVGVIMADAGLHMPDFRAGERTFSLITQVAGRAGRYFPDGKVFVQTYSPGREPVLFACKNAVEAFYNYELTQRSLMEFPPFSRLLRIVFRSFSKEAAYKTAFEASKILGQMNVKGAEIIGPAECPIERINSNWRYQILLKGKSIIPLQSMAREILNNYTHNQNVYIEYDVDPVSLL